MRKDMIQRAKMPLRSNPKAFMHGDACGSRHVRLGCIFASYLHRIYEDTEQIRL